MDLKHHTNKVDEDFTVEHSLKSFMSLKQMKDFKYTITDDGKVPYRSSYTLYISYSMCCSLAPNKLTIQLVNWV